MGAHVHAVGDESHGAARPGAPLGNFELMCGTMVQGRNLTDGLMRMARFARVMNTDMQLDVKTVRGKLHVSGVSRSPLTDARETYTDGFGMVLHCVVRWVLGVPARIVRVRSSALLAPRLGTSFGLFCRRSNGRGWASRSSTTPKRQARLLPRKTLPAGWTVPIGSSANCSTSAAACMLRRSATASG